MQVTDDYLVSPGHYTGKRLDPLVPSLRDTKVYFPTSFNGLLYVSDVPKTKTWDDRHLQRLTFADFVDALAQLSHLTDFRFQNGVQMTKMLAKRLTENLPNLQIVDFRGCGMQKNAKWPGKYEVLNHSLHDILDFQDD